MKKIGVTTTVPVEVLLAAGYTPVDLNNLFITSEQYDQYIDRAERDGFPKSLCAWIKGIYGACMEHGIHEVVGVLEGDCSNTKALIEILRSKGIKIYPFSFPHRHTKEDVKMEIDRFMELFPVTLAEVEQIRMGLQRVRKKARIVDRYTHEKGVVTGFENHLYQVSFSDFNGNIDSFDIQLDEFLAEIDKRPPIYKKIRLGYIGVPPMTYDLYTFAEDCNAHIVYNEVQREFAFPRAHEARDIYAQYYDYTYPYDLQFRLQEIKKQIELRQIDAVIHYTQAFCHKALEDIRIKEELGIPVLNIEGDKMNALDARTKLRLEAFLDMVLDLKEIKR